MFGQLSHELEINVPASEAWELCGTLRLAKLLEEDGTLIQKFELTEGDGGIGTVLKLTFPPGTPGFTDYKEKFTKLDNEKRLKEAEVIEGAYLELGFTFHRTRFEVIEMDSDTCILRTTIEYDVKEEAAANSSYATIDAVAKLAELAKNHLIKNKASKDTH